MTANKKPSGRDIALAFEKLGGVAGLVRWAKKSPQNRHAFYQMFAKTIMETSGGGSPDTAVNDAELKAKFAQALLGAVAACAAHPDMATPIHAGSVIIDGEARVANNDVQRVGNVIDTRKPIVDSTPVELGGLDDTAATSTPPVTPQLTPVVPPPPPPKKPFDHAAHVERMKQPTFSQPQSQGPNATELFLQSGGRYDSWSPPRSWSGW
jgi:hypothetical protein